MYFTFFNEKARVTASSGFLHSNLRLGRKSELGHPRGNCAYSRCLTRRGVDWQTHWRTLSLRQRAPAKKVSPFLQFVFSRFTSTCYSFFPTYVVAHCCTLEQTRITPVLIENKSLLFVTQNDFAINHGVRFDLLFHFGVGFRLLCAYLVKGDVSANINPNLPFRSLALCFLRSKTNANYKNTQNRRFSRIQTERAPFISSLWFQHRCRRIRTRPRSTVCNHRVYAHRARIFCVPFVSRKFGMFLPVVSNKVSDFTMI